mgnify:FL=1
MLLKTIFRWLAFLLVLAALPYLVYENLLSEKEAHQAERNYERTARQLELTTQNLREVEHRLTRLTTSVEAVEDEAREQHRMIKPGETLLLVERE